MMEEDKRRVGLLVDLSSEFIRSMMRGVSDEMSSNRNAGSLDLRFLLVQDVFHRKKVDAGWDAFIAQVQDDRLALALRKTGKPVVDVLCKKVHAGFAIANPDSREIGSSAARYFIRRGFRHFAYCGRPGVWFSDEREEGFREVVRNSGWSCADYTVSDSQSMSFYKRYVPCDEDLESPSDLARLRQWAQTLPPQTAVLCCHDHRAYQLLRVCAEIGRSDPKDVAILGVDNDSVLCDFAKPRLSSVDSNAYGVGRVAVRAVLQMLKRQNGSRPPRFLAPPREIVTRESTDVFGFSSPWLSETMALIHSRLAENITAADVVAATGFSHTKVEQTFVERLGMSVQQAIIAARLDRAEQLLSTTDIPIREVACRSGFGSFTYFCTSFLRSHGMTALVWRNRRR